MKPQGKRNWNYTEDFQKNGKAKRAKTQAKHNRMTNRSSRRTAKYLLKKETQNGR